MLLTYLVCAALFLIVDALWLKLFIGPYFARHIGDLMRENIRLEAAAGFYLIYIAAILYFCVGPALQGGGIAFAVLNGALLGALAYGTYEATNMATLRGWTWSMVAIDVGWGAALTGLTAGAGYLVASA